MESHVGEASAARIQDKADRLPDDLFLGGPRKTFEALGRLQLITLLREGLSPSSTLLDVGCGCLRGGYWLIHFLNRGCYFGIEPNEEMLELGRSYFLEPETLELKRPTFDTNPRFDFGVFGVPLDFVLARSVWTHASKDQIRAMLDQFALTASPAGTFLTSYQPARTRSEDYAGPAWRGRSHESDVPAMVRHEFAWIDGECRSRNLTVEELPHSQVHQQVWLRIDRAGSKRSIEGLELLRQQQRSDVSQRRRLIRGVRSRAARLGRTFAGRGQ